MGGFALSRLSIVVTDGLLAQRKLNGDREVDAPYSRGQLRSMVQEGKEAENMLRAKPNGEGMPHLQGAYRRAGVKMEQ